ncbi:MAG: polymer-forming cytoskeletal protein [Candidatus Buchananbacteria bacterium]|nr:polymer-forming cytoskeletal protein [Candidatus Buchananbacteria bacterium]
MSTIFKETTMAENDTIIGQSVRVEGEFTTEGNVIIDGVMSGSVSTTKSLRVGPSAIIFASVGAENASIAGEIQGTVVVTGKLELAATAKIFGDVKAGTLVIAAGAVLNGKCQMTDGAQKSPKPNPTKAKPGVDAVPETR